MSAQCTVLRYCQQIVYAGLPFFSRDRHVQRHPDTPCLASGFASCFELSEQFIQVADGGKCYFEADYRPDDRRLRLSYHGYA